MTSDIRTTSTYYSRALLYPAAILSLGAAAIHFTVAPGHLKEYLPFGVFFLVVGSAQAALALGILIRPGRLVIAGVALVGLGCVILWFISRTIGLHFELSDKLEYVQPADPLTGSPVHLDSVLVGPHETWEVAFLADNPGLWMLHCHVLVHAAYGLSTMVSYVGISTPYSIGSDSGNFPE